MNYHWPGNVRELENTVEYALTLSDGRRIEWRDLPPVVRETTLNDNSLSVPLSQEPAHNESDLGLSIKKHTQVLEKQLILEALRASAGVKTQAAKSLEISTKTLLYKLRQYQIDWET